MSIRDETIQDDPDKPARRKGKTVKVIGLADSPVPTALEFHFRDGDDKHKFVWTNQVDADVITVDNESFNRFRVMLKRFSVPIVDKNGDD